MLVLDNNSESLLQEANNMRAAVVGGKYLGTRGNGRIVAKMAYIRLQGQCAIISDGFVLQRSAPDLLCMSFTGSAGTSVRM